MIAIRVIHFEVNQEGQQVEEKALRYIAKAADGSMRDALSLLDQCASATTGELTAEAVYACLGIAGEQIVCTECSVLEIVVEMLC